MYSICHPYLCFILLLLIPCPVSFFFYAYIMKDCSICFIFFCEGYFCLSFFIVLNTSYFPILYHFTSLALFLYGKFVIFYSSYVCFQSYFSTKLFFLIFIELISFFFILLIFFPPFLFFFPLFFF